MTSAQSTKEELEHTVKRLEQDVALLKRENDILRKNQERSEREIQILESVLDSIPDVIGIQLPDHTVLRYNKAGYDLVDLEPDELRNKKCFELVGRASPCASCATTDAVESGSMAAHELYFPELGKHLNCRATPVFNQKGEISHVVEMLQDISEQKRIEQELKEKEQKYRRVVETAVDGFWMVDSKGWIEDVNQAYADMSGYDMDELVGMHVSRLEAQENLKDVEEHMLKVMKKGSDRFESRHRRKDGSVFDVEVSTSFDPEDNGSFTSFVRDITDRLTSEQILRESEAHYRSVVRAAPIGIGVVVDRVFSQVNDKICDMVGFSRDELLGRSARLLYPSEEEYAFVGREKYRQMLEHGTGMVETRFQRKDGRVIDVLLSSAPLAEDSLVQGVTFTALDITGRKRSEFALAEAKREFESIFDNSLVGIMLLRAGRTVHRGNRRLADILGYDSPDEMAGMSMRQLHLSQERFEDYDRRFYATLAREDQIQIEYRLKRKDGSPVWCSLSGKALDPPDLDQGVIWILDELESRKALENDLMQAIELSEAANRAKSEFLANMSHEIRTPLNGVLGMLQVMQTTDLDQEQLEYVDMAITSSQRLTRLLSDILDLTKIEADKLEISEDVFSLPQVMQSIKDIFSHAARENENELGIACDEALSDSLIGDSTRLTQILFNLVGNALKYTKKGRVDVSVLHLPPAGKGLARILFSVADTGPGIADDKIDKVFEAFTQANSTSSPYIRQFEGAGLGLPLVKRLVGLMGGNISIASQVNKGTTVYVSLPFRIPEGLQSGSSDHPIELTSKNRSEFKVLAVDDDEATRLHVQRILERQGYRVHVAKDGEHALAQLAQSRFDCILMDVQMPVLDGVEATRLIRASKATFRHVPIIALTAYAMSGDREKFIAAGMDDYIAKPVSREELLRILKRNLPD